MIVQYYMASYTYIATCHTFSGNIVVHFYTELESPVTDEDKADHTVL